MILDYRGEPKPEFRAWMLVDSTGAEVDEPFFYFDDATGAYGRRNGWASCGWRAWGNGSPTSSKASTRRRRSSA